jgi:hypothetical protein
LKRWLAALTLLTLSSSGSALGAPLLAASAEVEAAGGHDDNMFLSVSPDGLGTLLRLGGGYASLAPAVGGEVATGGVRLRLAYFGDFRFAEAIGRLDSHSVELRAWLPAWGPLRVHGATFAGAFRTTKFAADQYLFAGGEIGARLTLAQGFAAVLATRAELRALEPDAVTGARPRDRLIAPSLRLPWLAAPWLEIAPGAAAVMVSSLTDGTQSEFRRWRAGLDVLASAGIFTVSVSGWGGRISLGSLGETHAGGRLEIRVDVGANLQLFTAAELVKPLSEGASDHFARQLVSLGVAGRISARRVPTSLEPRDLRPRVGPGGVRFRIEARAARSVALVGSWNDWEVPGTALAATDQPGVWEISQPLSRGAHRYHFLIDGEARRPPDAPRYVPDGFGSEDGVVDVDVAAGNSSGVDR